MMDIFKTVPSVRIGLAHTVSKAVLAVHAYRQARSERIQLLTMSDRDLRDIGMSRIDALREAQKTLWRLLPVRPGSGDWGPMGCC